MIRTLFRSLEAVHGMIYFAPEADSRYASAGLDRPGGYFASRAAALGAVGAEVVIATFYNFNPALVRAAIPAAWDAATPADLLDARLRAVDLALRDTLGDDVLASDDMRTAVDLAREASTACTPEGRPLYAAHAALPWPDEPHLALWHATTLLREFRGDGHFAVLVAEGLDGCEALVTHGAASDDAVGPDVLRLSRGWSDEEWAAAGERLRARGWLDADGRLTAEGTKARDRIEARTDELAMAPWQRLGEDACGLLRTLVRPWSKAVVASGTFG
jgi:hypothetical protein